MGIDAFFTLISPASGQGKNTALGSLGVQPAVAPQGLSFADFILNQLNQRNQAQEKIGEIDINPATSAPDIALQSDNPLLAKDPKLDLAQLLIENPDIAERLDNLTLPLDASLNETIAFNQKIVEEVIVPLFEVADIDLESLQIAADEIIINDQIFVKQDLITSLDTLTPKEIPLILEALGLVVQDADQQGYIKYGLKTEAFPTMNIVLSNEVAEINETAQNSDTPELVYAVVAKSEEDAAALSEAGLNVIPVVQLVPPQKRNALGPRPALPGETAALQAHTQGIQSAAAPSPTQELAARLNNLIVGGDAQGHLADGDVIPGEFESTATFKLNGKNAAVRMAGDTRILPAPPQAEPPNGPPQLGQIINAPIMYSFGSENVLYPTTSETLAPYSAPATYSPVASLTNVITQTAHATQAHPATQMVAATIQKAAHDGQNKSLVLQLDPPELGKLRINMEFGKEKTVKVQVLTEKAETFLMLQRDASTLERILQDAGLNAENGLNFELADDGFDFNQNGSHDGHAQRGNAGQNDLDDGLLLETTMTWHVDPQSGHMRYNILA